MDMSTPHTNGRLVATFPYNGIPGTGMRVYIESCNTPQHDNLTDEDRFVVVDDRGARVPFRGRSWFPTMEAAVARCLHNSGWGSVLEDALQLSHRVGS